MIAYWLMYLVPAFPALLAGQKGQKSHLLVWMLLGILFTLLIGYRFEIGGDWFSYLYHFQIAQTGDFIDAITRSDPGYAYLNWLISKWGYDIYAVNLVCGAVFMTGLIVFARSQPYPWVAIAVAFPYLIMVLAMGYSRQGVALGFIFLALTNLELRNFWRYLFYIILATLFHKTALIMIPLGLFLFGKGWVMRALAILVAAYVLWDLFVAKYQEQLWEVYVNEQMVSEGARIRVWMNLVPSVILLVYWKSWKESFPNYFFWSWIATGSILAVVFVDLAPTAVDRVALYFIPIQVVVFSRLPFLARGLIAPRAIRTGIVLGYAAVLYVWLNYATHAPYWLPYQNILIS